MLGRLDCSDESCRFVRAGEIDYASRIGGPREAATNEQNRTNNRLHLRTRFSALEVVNRPRVRGEPKRSYGPTPDTHARLFSRPPCAEREPTCGPLTLTELRPLASATTNGHIQPESILGSPTELLGRLNCSDDWIARSNVADLCGLTKNTKIHLTAVQLSPRQTNNQVRTIDCTSDRDSALPAWLIARAIVVNRDVCQTDINLLQDVDR